MIGFWTPHLLFFKSNDTNNNDNHSNHNRHHVFPPYHGDRCLPVTFDISSPQNFESSKNSSFSSSSTAHYHRRHNDGFRLAAAAVATVIFFLVTASPTLAWVSTTTTFQHSLRTTTHHHRHSFTRDSSLGAATTADSTATMENLMTKNAVMPVSPLSPQQQQQQQSILLSPPPPQLTTTASWLFAPTVLSLLAVPSSASAAAASSRIQEAWDNVIGATLPESTPDLISVIVGEGMGYLTYFGVTAFLVASVWQNHQNHQQQQQQQQHDAEDVIVEYDEEDDSLDDPMLMMVSSSSLLTTTDNDHHVMLFEPVSSTEEDALVPCAFLLEQAQALEQQQTQTHQSLLHHLDWVEVFFDVTKWLSYFVLQSDLRGMTPLGDDILLENAIFGFVAGFGAKFYADVLYRHLGQGPAHKRQEMTQQPWPLACLMEGVSAASLFAAYEAVQEPVQDLVQWWSTVYTHLGHLDCSMWL